MNYFKGLVSNVRGFYSEINSATLTGAIDVVVIRQEDGSFCGSPFHVRFGKLGVLRSREKIVDILINGEAVDLQMKLGDAGEAFFVEEVDESSEIPSELSTTPIPSSFSLSGTIDEKKEEENEEDTPTESDDMKTPTTESIESKIIDINPDKNDIETQIGNKEKDSKSDDNKELESKEMNSIKAEAIQDNKNDYSSSLLKIKDDTGKDIINKSSEKTEEAQKTDEKEIAVHQSVLEEEKSKDDTVDVNASTSDSLEESDVTATLESDSAHSCSKSIPIPRRYIKSDDESGSPSWMTETSSIHHIKEERFQLDHMYPFSDLDSPIGSPPSTSNDLLNKPLNPQHCLSDTEIEIQQSQVNMNAMGEVTWDWGKLPQGPEAVYQKGLHDLKREEGKQGFRNKRKDYIKSHKIKEEGIYLDDLTSIDQEVAALYLHQALSKDTKKVARIESPSTEDRESGIGQSLPSSPNAELSNTKDSSGSESYSNIAMSLCGDLKSGKVPLENFMESSVTFDELSSNPALLNDPKLVIRINDRYYNWQIAAPMLMSYIVFQRPLKQETVQSLKNKHMPKKEKRRGYWFWRQNNDDQSSDEDDFDPSKEKHRPRMHSASRKPPTTTSVTDQDQDLISQKSLENEQKDINEAEVNENEFNTQHRLRNVSECTSGNESDVGYRKTTRLTSEQLAKLNLHDGANSIQFSVTTQYQGTAECQATIYLWNYHDRIVISDIDGTITKSDVLGQILPVVGQAWAQSGVAHFFTSIEKNGYKLLYLSARAIGQAQLTRDYLKSVKQEEITLPDGPLLLSPASLIKAFHREVIEKKPEEFKIAALRDIQGLFPTVKKPFYSGFGNKINDVYSYRAVGVSLSRIFTINHKGEVRNELTTTFQSSYLDLQNLVDQMFPPYKKEQSMKSSGLIAPDEFSSFTYWRNPLPDVDLSILDPQQSDDDVDVPVTFTS